MKEKVRRVMRKIKKMNYKLLIVLLAIAFLGVGTGAITTVRMLMSGEKYDYQTNLEKVADNVTMDNYSNLLISTTTGTRNAGRMWSDKSVTTQTVVLDTDTDGYEGQVKGNTPFISIFSALGSSQVINEYPPNPIDLVLVLDMSSSMNSGDDSQSRVSRLAKAADKMITDVLSLNKHNRVSVVLFDDNAYTLVPLDHYEIAEDSPDYVKGRGFLDKNPGSGTTDGATVVNGPDGLPIEYRDQKHQETEDIYYNFLAVEKGYPNVSSGKGSTDWGTEGAIYGTGTSYGYGRNVIFKYKPDETKGTDYNTDKYDGVDKANHDSDDKAVTLLQRTQGGTNVQSGYWLGLKHLADADTTPVSYELSTGEVVTRDFLPVIVTLTDGSSNMAGKYSTWWMPSAEGLDTLNTFSQDSGYSENNTSNKSNDMMNWYDVHSDAMVSLRAIMTAAYWKKIAQKNYRRDFQFYTIGLGLDNIDEKMAINPTGYLKKIEDLADENLDEHETVTAKNVYEIAQNYVAGGSPRYISYEAAELPDDRPDDYTFFHPTVTTDTKDASAYAKPTETYDDRREMNKDPNLANHMYRRYSVSSSLPPITLFEIDDVRQDPSSYKVYYSSYDMEDLDALGYVRTRNDGSDVEEAVKRNSANPIFDASSGLTDPNPKYTKEFFAKIDLTSMDDLKFNNRYFDIRDGAYLESVFDEIYTLIQGTVFEPVRGQNDAGISDSITYTDPIGLYMSVKNKAVNFDGTDYDMAMLLFGQMHGIVKTAVYDFHFNDAWMKKNKPAEQGHKAMQAGWYTSSDPETATFMGANENDGKWEDGNIYYLDYQTALSFLPTLSDSKISEPEDLPDDLKNIKYIVYRFAENSTERNVLRWNSAYGDRPTELTEGNPGVYRLSDIRIWIEDSEDYQADGEGTIDLGYDEALRVNIPVNAVPLQVATVTMDENGVRSFETNLNRKDESTPLRLFYGVGLQDNIITEDGLDVDVAKLSPEYLKKNRNGDNIYFYSNYYSATTYKDYITDVEEYRTRGDANLSFSASGANKYYSFQKPLEIFEVNDGEEIQSNGTYKEIPLSALDDVNAFKATHTQVKEKSQLKSDKWYYMITDYYIPGSTKPTYLAVARYGEEFGSGISGDNVLAWDYLCWYSKKLNEWITYDANAEKPVTSDDWVLATRPGGLRVGDMAQSRRAKSANLTETANNYYLPTVSPNTTGEMEEDDPDNIIINDYLGNNGRVTIKDTGLLVTKEVEIAGKNPDETYKDEEFAFDIYVENREGDFSVVKMHKNQFSGKWQLRISTIDAVTNNDGLLQNPDNSLYVYNKDGQDYYVFLGQTLTTRASGLNEFAFRVYSAEDNDSGVTLKRSGRTTYVNNPSEMESTDKVKYAQAGGENNVGSIDFWIDEVSLVPKNAYDSGAWDQTGNSHTKVKEFVISHLDSTKEGVAQISSKYLTKTEYLTTTLYFGYKNRPEQKPDSWPQTNWDTQKANVAQISLKHDEGVMLVGIESGTDYEVTENLTEEQKTTKKINIDRIELETLNSTSVKADTNKVTGHTESGKTNATHFINRFYYYTPVDLSISKTVSGSAGEKDKDFTFIVKVTPTGEDEIKSEYGYEGSSIAGVTKKDNGKITFVATELDNSYIGTVTLKHGQSLKIKGLPQNTLYEITEQEANLNNYETKIDNAKGSLVEAETKVSFENIKYARQDITISKTVTGNLGEKEREFTFEITLTPETNVKLANEYMYTGTKDGKITLAEEAGTYKGTIKLKHNDKITIKGIPEGTTYNVKELEANTEDYITTYTDASGKLTTEDGKDNAVTFVNTKYSRHKIQISKEVIGGAGNKEQEFTFKVTLTPATDVKLDNSYPYTGSSIDGITKKTDGTLSLTANDDGSYSGTITLKHGQSVIISNIPERTTYKVEEVEANQNEYITKVTGTVAGVLSKDIEIINFTNKKPTKHDLIISKEVTGLKGEQDKDFTFKVTLRPDTDITLKNSYNYVGSSIDGVIKKTDGTLSLTANGDGSYSGNVTLRHGQSITIKDIPEKTQYEVTEVEANQNGYVTTTSNNTKGELTGEAPQVKFINTKLSTNTLTISKEVQGSAGDKNKEWTFKITLTPENDIIVKDKYSYIGGSSIDGVTAKSQGEITFKPDGGSYVGEVTLKHGQSVTINDLPERTTYKVEEEVSDYIKVINGDAEGKLMDNLAPSVRFINKKPSHHDLQISKEVAGERGDKNKNWTFEITLVPDTYVTLLNEYIYEGSISGIMSFTKQADGSSVGRLTLKHGQNVTIKGLPENTKYKVVEIEANQDEYITQVSNNTNGTLTTPTTSVNYKNIKLGKHSITIKKNVSGNLGDVEAFWAFKITLTSPKEQALNGSYEYVKSDSTKGNIDLTKGTDGKYTGTIQLKANEEVTIKDLPEGATYQVEEIEANQNGYVTTFVGKTSGTIAKDDVKVEVYNKNYSAHTLTLKKEVTGVDVETSRKWTFEITLTPNPDAPFKNIYSFIGENHEDGLIEFTQKDGAYIGRIELSGGEAITIEDIPYDTAYSVEEIEANQNGYKTTYENQEGTITENVNVKIVNNRDIEIPNTSDSIVKYFVIIVITGIATFGMLLILIRYKAKKS